jgi:hypothetical protein
MASKQNEEFMPELHTKTTDLIRQIEQSRNGGKKRVLHKAQQNDGESLNGIALSACLVKILRQVRAQTDNLF